MYRVTLTISRRLLSLHGGQALGGGRRGGAPASASTVGTRSFARRGGSSGLATSCQKVGWPRHSTSTTCHAAMRGASPGSNRSSTSSLARSAARAISAATFAAPLATTVGSSTTPTAAMLMPPAAVSPCASASAAPSSAGLASGTSAPSAMATSARLQYATSIGRAGPTSRASSYGGSRHTLRPPGPGGRGV